MYNLFVIGNGDHVYDENPFTVDLDRFLEYTESSIKEEYQDFTNEIKEKLKKYPCIFAFENCLCLNPVFGYLTEITKTRKEIKIQYKILNVGRTLTSNELKERAPNLDIKKLELNRTHWALKDIDLHKILLDEMKITLPEVPRNRGNFNIDKHQFEVALTFAGEDRELVSTIAKNLDFKFGKDTCFYDENYTSELAIPSLDLTLRNIYSNAKLIVVFITPDYEKKKWCGLEFKVIKEILFQKESRNRIMYLKKGDFETTFISILDGYIDMNKFDANQLTDFISQRITQLNCFPTHKFADNARMF
jgi:hypothetical protein